MSSFISSFDPVLCHHLCGWMHLTPEAIFFTPFLHFSALPLLSQTTHLECSSKLHPSSSKHDCTIVLHSLSIKFEISFAFQRDGYLKLISVIQQYKKYNTSIKRKILSIHFDALIEWKVIFASLKIQIKAAFLVYARIYARKENLLSF